MDLISKLLTLHNQLKVYHWQTDSYAQHQAFGGAYDAFTGHIDQFVEEFMGQYSRIMNKEGFKAVSSNITDKDPEKFIEEYIQYLIVELPKGLNEKDTNLLNIRDEMLGELQKLKYLLTLK
jgi:DNA-binding ferritin-like protein